MSLTTAFLFLAALLHPSDGQDLQNKQIDFHSLSDLKLENQRQILEQFNEIRRSVVPSATNMLEMMWSAKTAKNAQNWANKCEMSVSPRDQRVLDGVTCGENILVSSNPKTWPEAIQFWNSQSSNFKYGLGAITKSAKIRSYTQLIWYNSYKVGCAVAYCPNNQFNYFYVCQYCPAGNNAMEIATPYKSGPVCADCPDHCNKGLCTNPCKFQNAYSNCDSLKTTFGCNHPQVKENCAATCKCTTEII